MKQNVGVGGTTPPTMYICPSFSPSFNTQQGTPLPGAILVALCHFPAAYCSPSLQGKATASCLGLWRSQGNYEGCPAGPGQIESAAVSKASPTQRPSCFLSGLVHCPPGEGSASSRLPACCAGLHCLLRRGRAQML